MYTKLVEASKQETSKGAYKLEFDENNKLVKVLSRKSGELCYVVSGDHDEMLKATLDYFGLKGSN
jgi:hypothetical protein